MKSDESRIRMEFVPVAEIMHRGEGWDAHLTRYQPGKMECAAGSSRDIVEAVTLEKRGKGFRVISGFRRAAAAREAGVEAIPAIVYDEGALSNREAFLMALSANAPGTSLTDADRAFALQKALTRFGFSEEDLVAEIAPLVGLPQSRKVVREYVAIAGLPHPVLDALASGEKSREHASALLLCRAEDRDWFFGEVVEALSLSASDTRLVAALAGDIAAREGKVFRDVVTGALPLGEANPGSARRLLKDRLARRMRPVLQEMEDEFDALLSRLAPPEEVILQHAPGFESDTVTLRITAGDTAGFKKASECISRGLDSGIFDDMTSIARRKAEETARDKTGDQG